MLVIDFGGDAAGTESASMARAMASIVVLYQTSVAGWLAKSSQGELLFRGSCRNLVTVASKVSAPAAAGVLAVRKSSFTWSSQLRHKSTPHSQQRSVSICPGTFHSQWLRQPILYARLSSMMWPSAQPILSSDGGVAVRECLE